MHHAIFTTQKISWWAGKVMGSNPGAVYWMEKTFFTLICCKKLYCLL